jgi:hypothetical protein
MLRVHRFMSDFDQKNLFIDLQVPMTNIDRICVHFWNGEGNKKTCFDQLSIKEFHL